MVRGEYINHPNVPGERVVFILARPQLGCFVCRYTQPLKTTCLLYSSETSCDL
jgi:hypothetical protein